MEQDRPSKWNPQAVAWGIAALALVAVLGGEAALGSAWNIVFGALMGLVLLWGFLNAYRRRGQPFELFPVISWVGLALVIGAAVVSAFGAEEVRNPMILLGAVLFFAADYKNRTVTGGS
jgi:hypothetical protein